MKRIKRLVGKKQPQRFVGRVFWRRMNQIASFLSLLGLLFLNVRWNRSTRGKAAREERVLFRKVDKDMIFTNSNCSGMCQMLFSWVLKHFTQNSSQLTSTWQAAKWPICKEPWQSNYDLTGCSHHWHSIAVTRRRGHQGSIAERRSGLSAWQEKGATGTQKSSSVNSGKVARCMNNNQKLLTS